MDVVIQNILRMLPKSSFSMFVSVDGTHTSVSALLTAIKPNVKCKYQ